MDKEELTVDGYIFATPDDAEIARNELKKIAYIEERTDLTKTAVVKSIYEQLIDQRTFQTPVGFDFLRKLRLVLIRSKVPEEDIKPVPLFTTFKRISLNNDEKVKRRVTKAEKRELSLKAKYRNAVLVAVIMTILVVAMFFITMFGTTPNILNYKSAITNQYSAWEQELTEREAVVREKERELDINN